MVFNLPKYVFVFGANGQDEKHLMGMSSLLSLTAYGISRFAVNLRGDVWNFGFATQLIAKLNPFFVFNLAANWTTRHDAPLETHTTISTGTLNILEAVRLHCPDCRIFVSGSGIQFVNQRGAISKRDKLSSICAYVVFRIQSVFAARFFLSLGVKGYVGYLFHHDGPLRPEKHVNGMVNTAAKRVTSGDTVPLVVGDKSVRKEWAHARDIVGGMWALVNQDEVFESTLGTGVDHSIPTWIEACFSSVGLHWRDWTQQREAFKVACSRLVSMRRLGWMPEETVISLARKMVGVQTSALHLP